MYSIKPLEKVKSIRSQVLDLLRFPLAIIIVTDHVFCFTSLTVRGTTYDLSEYDIYMSICAFIKAFFYGHSVPIYFFIAGYVFFLGINLDTPTYIRKLKNRFRSLLVPYVVWNTLAIIMKLLQYLPCLHSFFPNCNYHDLNLNIGSILSCLWADNGELFNIEQPIAAFDPIDFPLWFVRNLIIIVVLTPLINFCYKKFGFALPTISGILWFVCPNLLGEFTYRYITAIFFFSLGGFFSFRGYDMIEEFKKYKIISYILYPMASLILLITFYMGMWGPEEILSGFGGNSLVYLKNLSVFIGLFFAYNLSAWLVKNRGTVSSKILSTSSFFIYAGHALFLQYILRSLTLVFPPMSQFNTLVVFVMTDGILCIGLLGIYIFMKSHSPKMLSVFTGGRL